MQQDKIRERYQMEADRFRQLEAGDEKAVTAGLGKTNARYLAWGDGE